MCCSGLWCCSLLVMYVFLVCLVVWGICSLLLLLLFFLFYDVPSRETWFELQYLLFFIVFVFDVCFCTECF